MPPRFSIPVLVEIGLSSLPDVRPLFIIHTSIKSLLSTLLCVKWQPQSVIFLTLWSNQFYTVSVRFGIGLEGFPVYLIVFLSITHTLLVRKRMLLSRIINLPMNPVERERRKQSPGQSQKECGETESDEFKENLRTRAQTAKGSLSIRTR